MATNAKQIENWGLFFPRDDNPKTKDASFSIREGVVKEFVGFLDNKGSRGITFSHPVFIGGRDSVNGGELFTKKLVSVIRPVPYTSGRNDLFRATDCSGMEYLFSIDTNLRLVSGYMRLMIKDIKGLGLERIPFYYVPEKYRYTGPYA